MPHDLPGITICSLRDRPELADRCARIAAAEWEQATGYGRQDFAHEFAAILAGGGEVLAAIGEIGDPPPAGPPATPSRRGPAVRSGLVRAIIRKLQRCEPEVHGVVTLIETETPAETAGLSPWASALVVAPASRRRGIGAALLDAACACACDRGATQLHALTEIPAWFEARGWRQIGCARARGIDAAIVARTL